MESCNLQLDALHNLKEQMSSLTAIAAFSALLLMLVVVAIYVYIIGPQIRRGNIGRVLQIATEESSKEKGSLVTHGNHNIFLPMQQISTDTGELVH